MQKKVKKLQLHRETIRGLQGSDSQKVLGGTNGPTGYDQIEATGCACYTANEPTYCAGFVSIDACP
jgi:hypothetical protein